MTATPVEPGYAVAAVDGTEECREGMSARAPAGPLAAVQPDPGLPPTRVLVPTLALVSLVSGVVTLLTPHLLTGPPAMNGSAKGTALVVALGGATVLAIAHRRARHGSRAALAMAAGATAYLVYNAILLVFATPFNRAFLLYEAMLALGIWSLVTLTIEVWRRSDCPVPPPRRWAAGFVLGVVALNVLAWAGDLAPALLSTHPRSMLTGTGLTTNPVYVQDLAFWLPTFTWVAAGMWRGHGPRTALGAVVLTYWVLESVSVAADQWWGWHADPASPVASVALVPVFVSVGVLTVWPLTAVLKTLSSHPAAAVGGAPVVDSHDTTGV